MMDYSELRGDAMRQGCRPLAIPSSTVIAILDELDALRLLVTPTDGRKKAKATPEDEKCARWIYGLLLTINPSTRKPNWSTWFEDVRKMRTIDGRSHRDICELFQWAQKDSFWCMNILCPKKLRDKWDRLVMQRSMPVKKAASAWWTSDATINAKGAEFGLYALPGESMNTFQGRIKAYIENDGNAPPAPRSRVISPTPVEVRGMKPEGLDLRSLVKRMPP